MVEHTSTAADEPHPSGADPESHTSFEQLAAEPERVASEAATRPVRIERSDGSALVLLNAETFAQLQLHVPKAMYASEMSEADIEEMLAQPIPAECAAFDDEVPDGWLDAQR